MKRAFLLILFLFTAGVSFVPSVAHGDSSLQFGRRPAFRVPPVVTVETDTLTLETVARFADGEPQFAELVRSLREIPLGPAPGPGMNMTLLGSTILDAVRSKGIDPGSIGYSIPQTVVVTRKGRTVTKAEVMSAVREDLWSDPRLDLQIRDVSWQHDQTIPTGESTVKVQRLGVPAAGKMPIRVEVRVNEKPAARFLASAIVDDWREIPVLKNELERGMLISPSDIEVVRLNLSQFPPDVASAARDVIGYRLKSRIGAGEAIRHGSLDRPPTVEKGKRVRVTYKRGALTATMLGTAVQDGFLGQELQVRNDTSKKIVRGIVRSEEEVEILTVQ